MFNRSKLYYKSYWLESLLLIFYFFNAFFIDFDIFNFVKDSLDSPHKLLVSSELESELNNSGVSSINLKLWTQAVSSTYGEFG